MPHKRHIMAKDFAEHIVGEAVSWAVVSVPMYSGGDMSYMIKDDESGW